MPNRIVLNHLGAVLVAMDKRLTFRALDDAGVPTLRWFTDPSERTEGTDVYVRHSVASCGGFGIQIVTGNNELPNAPLYTEAFPTHREYRVHVGGGKALLVHQKKRRNGVDPDGEDARIRNYGEMWVFAINDLKCDEFSYREDLEQVAIDAVAACGLDFGAVDVLVSKGPRKIVVCEVNSAPGVGGSDESSTIKAYTDYLRERISA